MDYTLSADVGELSLFGPEAQFRVYGPQQTALNTPLAVQGGVLRALQIALAPLDVPAFDHVPDAQPFPFVQIASQQMLEMDGADISGLDHHIYLSVWSEYRGQKEVLEILAAIRTGLHDKTLLLDHGAHVLCRVTEQRTERDADGMTYMGAAILRIITSN